MTLEEILVKIGLDGNALDKGLRTASVGLKEFGAHASEHMDKAATSGRALHGVLEGIGKISPGLALGLTAAFSGPMAALELFKMGLEAIKEHYAKIREESKAALENAEKLREAGGDLSERARTLQEEENKRGESAGGPISDEERQRIKDLEYTDVQIKEAEERLRQAKERLKQTQDQERNAGSGSAFAKAREQYEAQAREVNTLALALSDLKNRRVEQTRVDKEATETAKKEAKERTDAAKEFDRLDAEIDEQESERKKKAREEDEALAKFEDDWADHAYKVKKDLAEKTKQLQQLENAPYTPSTSELAKFNTPYGELARLIQQREGQAKFASAHASPEELAGLQQGFQANTAQLRSDLAASGGNPLAIKAALERSGEGLRKMQGEHGSDPHLQALEKARDSLKELESLAKHDGIVVQPPPD